MREEVALIIIYNHRYDKNIETLERIYKKNFSNIFHLMPFYDGDRQNVIPVYGNSFYFQGFIAQGLKNYFDEKYLYYFFIADDLILNPVINESNCTDHFDLDKRTSFVPGLMTLHEQRGGWHRIKEAYNYSHEKNGVEAANELPTYNEAIEKFKNFKLTLSPLSSNQLNPSVKLSKQTFRNPKEAITFMAYLNTKIKSMVRKATYELSYPLVGSYSDIAIIPAGQIKEFCHYCGVFSATELFVELALPTALVLSAEKIITEKDLQLQGKALWTDSDLQELNKYNNNLNKLLSNFPEHFLYLHPIKLSNWNTQT